MKIIRIRKAIQKLIVVKGSRRSWNDGYPSLVLGLNVSLREEFISGTQTVLAVVSYWLVDVIPEGVT